MRRAEKGPAGVLDVDGEKVTVTVRSIRQKKIPVITDEMIEALGIEGVSDVEQYEDHLIREQKKDCGERGIRSRSVCDGQSI